MQLFLAVKVLCVLLGYFQEKYFLFHFQGTINHQKQTDALRSRLQGLQNQTSSQQIEACVVICYTDKVVFVSSRKLCNVYPLTPHFDIVKLGFSGVFIFFLFLL